MSFPVNSKTSGSLCYNIVLSMDPLPKQLRPSIENLFAKVASFVDLTSLYPGNAKDLSRCTSLLSRQIALSDNEQSAYKNLLKRALKIQQAASSEDLKKSSAVFPNLNDALFTKRSNPPSLTQLLLLIQELIELTGMECWPLCDWTHVMQTIYPYEERSSNDKASWESFVKFYDRRPSRLNQLLGDFAKIHDEAEMQRDKVEYLRYIIDKDPQERLDMLFEFKDLKETNWHQQSAVMQRLLNALLTEQSAELEMREFLVKAWKFALSSSKALTRKDTESLAVAESVALSHFIDSLGQKNHQIGIGEIFKTLSDLNLQKINHIIETQDRISCSKAEALFGDLYDKIEKISSGLYTEKGQSTWQQQHDLAQRAFRRLDQLKSSISKSITSADPHFSKSFSAIYTDYLEREVDLHSLEFQARILLLQLTERCKALFEGDIGQIIRTGERLYSEKHSKKPLDMGIAGVALPALITFQSRFEHFWSQALASDSPIEAKFSQGIGDLSIALSLLQISQPCRRNLYEISREKLREFQPQKRHERREALQYTKIYPYLCHPNEVLPDSLFQYLKLDKSQKRSLKDNLSAEQRVICKIAPKSEQEDAIFESWLENNSCIIPKGLNARYLGSWCPPFKYHARVSRWFDALLPLNPKIFSEYCSKPLAYQKLMVQLHQFIPLADFFCQRGIELNSESSRGEKIRRLLLPAELRIADQRQQGIIIWALNESNVCYHRFFHVKLETDLIFQTVQKAFKTSQLSRQSDLNVEGIKLQFENREEDFVKIDELAKMALLRHAKISDLALELRFVN